MKKKNFSFEEIKKIFFKRKPPNISKKSQIKFLHKDFKSLYYTSVASSLIILFFYFLPTFIDFRKNTLLTSVEIENKSKTNLERVLKGQPLKKILK